MDKGQFKNILIIFLFSVSAFSIFKFIFIQKEKYDLTNGLNEVKNEITVLQKEKQDILQEVEKEKDANRKLQQGNTELKKYLRAGKIKINSLFATLKEADQEIEGINSKFSLLKLENEALQQEKERILQEAESFKTKLSSITELKKTIKELKKQARETRRKARIETKDSAKINKVIEGNYGYLVKDGKETYPTKLKIEVIPTAK